MRSDRATRLASGAVLDPTGAYRYRLWRRWAAGPSVLFVLLNPSTADAERDDPTVRRCMAFARRWGFGAVEIVNLFALRTAVPRRLRAAPDPVGPDNDRHIALTARRADLIVAGWGAAGAYLGRSTAVAGLLRRQAPLYCLGRTACGQPRHPLYVRGDARPSPWP
jgi:hypothetical protein